MIPFSSDVYFSLFEAANTMQWPVQLAIYAALVAMVILARKPTSTGNRLIPAILAIVWCWIGFSFFGRILASVLWAAWIFEVMFLVQAALLLGAACRPKPMVMHLKADNIGWSAASLIVVCALLYPVLAAQLGHAWPSAQLIGIAPTPTDVLTISFLSLAPGTSSKLLAIIPALFLAISAYVAWELAIWEDLLLVTSGFMGLVGLYRSRAAESI